MVGYELLTEKRLSHYGHAAAGIMSGVLTRYVSQPLDVLKIRFQLQHEPLNPTSQSYYWSIRQASSRIFHEESLRALWKGHVPAQLLSALYGLTQFQTFEILTKYVHLNLNVSGPPRLTDFVSGSLAGAAGTLASMPCDTIRTRLVSQGEPKIYRGVVHALISMIRKEGFLSLYNGLVPSLALIMPQTGVQFASFRLFVESYWVLHGGGKTSSKLPLVGNLVCGSLAGLVAKTSVYPLDLCKKRFQVQGFEEARLHFGRVTRYTGVFDCILRTAKEEGIRGLYKGLTPSIIKAMITTALTFTLYEEISHIFRTFDLFIQN